MRWETPGIGQYLTVLGAQGVVLLCFLMILETGILRRLCCCAKGLKGLKGIRVAPGSSWTFQKNYDSTAAPALDIVDASVRHGGSRRSNGNRVAVDHVSLSLRGGQCVCLMGHNGAGKTSLFSALTGRLNFSTGTAIMTGHDVSKRLFMVRTDKK